MDGISLFCEGKTLEAVPLLEEEAMREHIPGEATLCLGAARTLISKDRSYLDEAVNKTRGNVPSDGIMSFSGTVLWDIGLRQEGAERMRRAIDISPDRGNMHVCASRFEKDPSYLDEAFVLYNRILGISPQYVPALIGRGCVNARRQMICEAQVDFEAAVRVDPQDASAHYELGNILATQGKYQQASEEFEAAVRLSYWQVHMAHAGIAFCLYKLHRTAEAKREAERSLQTMPGYKYAQELLQDIQEQEKE